MSQQGRGDRSADAATSLQARSWELRTRVEKTPQQIQELAREVRITSFVDFTVSPRGITRGDNIAAWMDTITGQVPIEALPIKFAAVATDARHRRTNLIAYDACRDKVMAQHDNGVTGFRKFAAIHSARFRGAVARPAARDLLRVRRTSQYAVF